MNILKSMVTLEQHTFLCIIKHTFITLQMLLIIFKVSKELTESSKESYPNPIYLALMHWHLLNPNSQFGAGHRVRSHVRIKRNILKLSWEGGVERIGKNKRNRDIEIARQKEEIRNSLIHIWRHFSMLVKGGK